MMKRFIFTAIGVIILLSAYSQDWIMQQTNTTADLNSICFVNPDLGWAVGSDGTILKTINGGDTWVLKTSGVANDLYSVHFIDPLTGFAVSYGELLKTTDGGDHWVVQDTVINAGLATIFFIGSDTGFIAGTGRILKTTDNGETWIKQNGFGCFGVKSFWATDPQTLYMGGADLLTMKSLDGGVNWDVLIPNIAYGTMESIFFTDHNTGYFAGGGWAQGNTFSYFAKIIDGVATRTNPLRNLGKWLSCVFFTDTNNGYITALDGSILKTTDAGDHWTSLTSGVNSALTSIFFTDSITGYAAGRSGIILKTTNGGLAISGPDVMNKPIKIYPNPVSDFLMVESNYTPTQKSELQLYNISGQLMLQQDIHNKKSELDLSKLPKGVYVLKILSPQGIEVIKFDKM
ncbi:MAG: T9SS type A sorting domain-containing protein [Lentimicrobium sp.]|nr:T9SS type A sorting domain-containing protein [Lentimicrobium sp.]